MLSRSMPTLAGPQSAESPRTTCRGCRVRAGPASAGPRDLLAAERHVAVTIDIRHLGFGQRLALHQGERQMPRLGHQPRGVEIADVVARAEMPDAAMAPGGKPLGRLGDVGDHDRRQRHVGRGLHGLALGQRLEPALEDAHRTIGEHLGHAQDGGRQRLPLDRLLDGELLGAVFVLRRGRRGLVGHRRLAVEHLAARQEHQVGAAVGQAAHEIQRVVDVDAARSRRVALADLHAGDGGADEGDVIGAALQRREIRIAEIEENAAGRLPARPARRCVDRQSELAAMHLQLGADETVASDDECATAFALLHLLEIYLLHRLDVEVARIVHRVGQPAVLERLDQVDDGFLDRVAGLEAQLVSDLLRRHVIGAQVVGVLHLELARRGPTLRWTISASCITEWFS